MDVLNEQVKLREARKELAALIAVTEQIQKTKFGSFNREPARSLTIHPERLKSVEFQCLKLLRKRPRLAEDRFYRTLSFKLYPLSFLLQIGADKSTIDEVYRMNPGALTEKIYSPVAKWEPDGYPLHLACESKQKREGVIPFLVDVCPKAAQQKNASGLLPIHVLLQNRKNIGRKEEVEALLDATGEAFEKYLPGLLHLAFENDQTSREVFQVLVERFPEDCKSFHLGGQAAVLDDSNHRFIAVRGLSISMTPMRVEVLGKLMPKLEKISCIGKHWQDDAFQGFTRKLTEQVSTLTDLTLHLPSHLLRSQKVSHLNLEKIISNTTTLRRLYLDFGPYHLEARNKQLNADTASRVEAMFAGVFDGLIHNRSLRECHFTGDLVNFSELSFIQTKFWPNLACLLRNSNDVLEVVSVPDVDQIHHINTNEIQEVRYLLALNRLGRRKVCNVNSTVAVLVQVLDQVSSRTVSSVDKFAVAYGILKECPGLWCRNFSSS